MLQKESFAVLVTETLSICKNQVLMGGAGTQVHQPEEDSTQTAFSDF